MLSSLRSSPPTPKMLKIFTWGHDGPFIRNLRPSHVQWVRSLTEGEHCDDEVDDLLSDGVGDDAQLLQASEGSEGRGGGRGKRGGK